MQRPVRGILQLIQSTLQPAHFIYINGMRIPVDHGDDSQPNCYFRCRNRHNKENKYLSCRILVIGGKGNQQQIHRVEHQLNTHKNNNGVTARQYAQNTNHKKNRTQVNKVLNGDCLKNLRNHASTVDCSLYRF